MNGITALLISIIICPVVAFITIRAFDVIQARVLKKMQLKYFQEWLDNNNIHYIHKSVGVSIREDIQVVTKQS